MAQRTILELVDDLDGGKADETVTFALDGVEFEIDLSADHAAALRNTLAEFVGHARRIGGRKQRSAGAPKTNGNSNSNGNGNGKPDTQAVREWARSQGEQVAERGRVPQALVIRFQEAHQN
ncbi:histone-like nucleoid-structuring protein Lsr2 [Actinophytocola glycyrrhizae]|uniref:Lsr2 family protein n=1 Tax=Actinophytocola glycyrrhizae TaxID=2044873 RepID=A0ABV9SEN9_9PSEU